LTSEEIVGDVVHRGQLTLVAPVVQPFSHAHFPGARGRSSTPFFRGDRGGVRSEV